MFQFNYLDFLNAVISVETPTSSKGSVIPGPVKTGWTARVSGIPASIQPLSGAKIDEWGKLGIEVDYEVIHQTSTANPIVVGERVNDGTYHYLVQHFEDQGGVGLVFAAYVKRIIE